MGSYTYHKIGRIKMRKTDEEIFQDYKKYSRHVKHFLTITFLDATVRTNCKTRERTATMQGMILTETEGQVRLLNLDSPFCKPEYIEKLKRWDMLTELKYWCHSNDIPYERFQKRIMKRQLLSVVGKTPRTAEPVILKIHNYEKTLGVWYKLPAVKVDEKYIFEVKKCEF